MVGLLSWLISWLVGWFEIPGPIHSSKNDVYVHFVTDSSRNLPGFRLEWIVDGKQQLM
jgi:hypothetical protein